jgi:hypothetical protein
VQNFVVKNRMAVLHPTYSPDLDPSDFFTFSRMKMQLKGRRFDTVEGLLAETQTVLNTPNEDSFY